MLVAGGADVGAELVELGLGHDRSIASGMLARNGIATAAASHAVLSRTMAVAHQLDNSLEALSNLLYLLRRSLDDPAKATTYLDLADRVLIDIAAKHSLRRDGPPDADNL
jgi:phosphoglycerate-specific signal transduction histidine kinase